MNVKPKVFIGSSAENVSIAHTLQESLEYDAEVTVWDQDIFKPSSTSLDDLIIASNNCDYAIFIFKPDDVTVMRNESLNTIRDNVIFELGLFIGKLGKSKVFYITPLSTNFHLPSDLLGHNAGTYDDTRSDNNLKAALNTFCNKVRKAIKEFYYIKLSNFENETKLAKDIAVNKPKFWPHRLAAELLSSKLIKINEDYDEIIQNRVIQKKSKVNREFLLSYIDNLIVNFSSLADQFKVCFYDLTRSFGASDIPADAVTIKKSVDRMIHLCNVLISMEREIYSLETNCSCEPLRDGLKGWSKDFIVKTNSLSTQLAEAIELALKGENVTRNLTFELEAPDHLDEIGNFINECE